MCMNNFRHDLSSILLPQTFKGFDDLCTKAHDVEAHLSKRRRPRGADRLESSTAAVVETKKSPVVVGGKKSKETKKMTIKERKEKKDSFSDDMIEDLFDDLLQQNWIALPEIKRPHEVGKVDDPKDCRYHATPLMSQGSQFLFFFLPTFETKLPFQLSVNTGCVNT